MPREQFGVAGGGENISVILGENREMGWKAVPPDAPEFVKKHVTEYRTALLAGRETRGLFSMRCGATIARVVEGAKRLVRAVWTPKAGPKPERSYADTILEAREICRKNGITHFLDGELEDDPAVISRRRNLLSAIMS
jgi:hypothetical protein